MRYAFECRDVIEITLYLPSIANNNNNNNNDLKGHFQVKNKNILWRILWQDKRITGRVRRSNLNSIRVSMPHNHSNNWLRFSEREKSRAQLIYNCKDNSTTRISRDFWPRIAKKSTNKTDQFKKTPPFKDHFCLKESLKNKVYFSKSI